MKIKCRRCDICEREMEKYDFQYWVRGPRITYGRPNMKMTRMDICDKCFTDLLIYIRRSEIFSSKEDKE